MLLNAVSLTVTVSVLRATESLSPKGVDVLAGDERVGGLIKKKKKENRQCVALDSSKTFKWSGRDAQC